METSAFLHMLYVAIFMTNRDRKMVMKMVLSMDGIDAALSDLQK